MGSSSADLIVSDSGQLTGDKVFNNRFYLRTLIIMIDVNPKHPEYKELIGKEAIVPFFERKVPIRANPKVDMEFGTGALYVCSFGDMEDAIAIAEEGLEPVEVMNADGTFNT